MGDYDIDPLRAYCSCPAWRYGGHCCKHLRARAIPCRPEREKVAPPALTLFARDARAVAPGWLWSEKFDGIRALWDGARLISRGGVVLDPPFAGDLPARALDGELWAAPGDRSLANAALRWPATAPGWARVTFLVFDAPDVAAPLADRYAVLEALALPPGVRVVPQTPVGADPAALRATLASVQARGGEGLVLRDPLALPYTGRSRHKGVKAKSAADLAALAFQGSPDGAGLKK